jgi:hypothetical protein
MTPAKGQCCTCYEIDEIEQGQLVCAHPKDHRDAHDAKSLIEVSLKQPRMMTAPLSYGLQLTVLLNGLIVQLFNFSHEQSN